MNQEQLFESIRRERNPHAILLSGPAGAGKRELARQLAALYCTGEPNAARLEKEPNYMELGIAPYYIDDIRAITESAGMMGFNGGRRAYVLLDAHRMTQLLQNALLKTIEEPPRDSIFILTGSETGLLQTIRSRCAVIRLGADDPKKIAQKLVEEGIDPVCADLASRLSGGVPGLAGRYAAEPYQVLRNAAADLLEAALFSQVPVMETAKFVSADKGASLDTASETLTVWELLLSDALKMMTGHEKIRNADKQKLVTRIAKSFTIRAVQGMIDKVIEAETKLFYRPNAAFLMDAALVGISEFKEQIG